MIRRVTQCLATLTVLAFSMPVFAASVFLDPAAATVNESSTFTVDLVLSAADAPGSHPGAIGGQIVIDFNPALASFDGFAISTPATLQGGPTASTGSPRTVSLWFENARDVGVVGTFMFTALGSAGSVINIGIADQDDFMGSFANTLPSNQAFWPTFLGTSVAITQAPPPPPPPPPVPVPAAAWLMLSGLGLLGPLARRRRT